MKDLRNAGSWVEVDGDVRLIGESPRTPLRALSSFADPPLLISSTEVAAWQ